MNSEKQLTAFVREVFSSAQGEGVNIGRRQLFVRFCDCHRNCLYCDTDFKRTDTIDIEYEPGSNRFTSADNPVTPDQLLEIVSNFDHPQLVHDDLFITGGEPLLHADYLAEFLPAARKQMKLPVHLETSGDLVIEFIKVAPFIDHVLMDIKLPSVTGNPESWEEHQRFLEKIKTDDIGATIKLVVSADTSDQDLAEAVELITATHIDAHVVLQPMTAALKTDRVPTARQVLSWQAQMAATLGHTVRIIPQCHKLMGML